MRSMLTEAMLRECADKDDNLNDDELHSKVDSPVIFPSVDSKSLDRVMLYYQKLLGIQL